MVSELRVCCVGAAGQFGEGQCERFDAPFDVLRGRELVGAVAPAVAAGDEYHAGGSKARHEQRVMVCAADHLLVARSQLLRSLRRRLDHLCSNREDVTQ